MEIFPIYDSKGNLKEEADMFMFYSPCGVLYYGNIVTGRIKWGHDLKRIPYLAARLTDDEPYADVGQDGNTLHLYSSDSVSQSVILGDTEQDLQRNLKKIFGKDAMVTRNENVLYLKSDSGEETNEGDKKSFKILMTEWRVSIEGSWRVLYVNVDAFSRCIDDSWFEMSSLYHARTNEKFLKLCDRFNVYELPGDGILPNIINSKRRRIA